jgi:hypothetical protein
MQLFLQKKHVGRSAATACCGLAFSFVMAAGCSTNRAIFGGPNKPAAVAFKTHSLKYNYTDKTKPGFYLGEYDKPGADQQKVRNEILNEVMGIIDANYGDYEDTLGSDKALQEMSTDIVALMTSTASTLVGAKETKTILSAISSVAIGINGSIDKQIFQNNTIQALEMQMRSQRAVVAGLLTDGMTNTVVNYPLQAGLRDLVAYYRAGTLSQAMIGIGQTSSAAAKTNEDALNSKR